MKTTFDLYRCKAVMWADLSYRDALQFRIERAKEAMLFYKTIADSIDDKYSTVYIEVAYKYSDSENAVEWNRRFLREIQ